MNDTQVAARPVPHEADSEADLIDLLIVLARRKRLVIGLPLAVGIGALALSFAMPPVFRASTTLLPPQQPQSGAAALLSQLGGVANVVSGGAMKNPSDTYVAMLKSRTVADRLIAKFKLDQVYATNTPQKTRDALAAATTVTVTKEGLILVDVEDLDRQRAAPLANGYVAELLGLTRELALTENSQRRKFFEAQLEQSKDKLAAAELTLKKALDSRGVISVDSDSRVIVETIGRLRAQITAKEIELSAMSTFVTVNNQDYKRANQELLSLRAELSRLENGRPDGAPAPAGAGRQVGLENIKVLREVKYHQMLYEILAKQYEAARLDEAKEASVIQVLDPAIEPERKYRPKRALWGLGAFLGTLFLVVAGLFAGELKRRASPARAARYALLAQHLGQR